MKIKLAISGCCGRMGSRIAHFAFRDPEIELVGGLEDEQHSDIGMDLGERLGQGRANLLITADPEKAFLPADVIVEFTTPQASISHLAIASRLNKKMVIGTTGFTPQQLNYIKEAGKEIALLYSPNMSIGVNVLFKILPLLTRLLNQDYNVEILELHHRKKRDAPSGTAKKIAEIIKSVRKNLEFVYGREGATGPRDEKELGIHALRLGEIVGEHKIIFAGNDEKIELSHSALSRDIFARGAILGAKFLSGKGKGLYSMQDVLSERLQDEDKI